MKSIMLIGDSIRLGYMPYVKEMLEGKAIVYGSEDNSRFARYSLYNCPTWIREAKEAAGGNAPDIIHWNNGLWDAMYNKEDWFTTDTFTHIDEYIRDMEKIYNILANSGARVIFATTTPVGLNCPRRRNEDIDAMNKRAISCLTAKGADINDLNAFVKPHLEEYISEDTVHMTQEGYKAIAGKIVEKLEQYI